VTLLTGNGIFGGGWCWWLGDHITVYAGTSVVDSATLHGANEASAGGTVTYTVYESSWGHSHIVASGGTVTVNHGVVPDSKPVVLTSPGTYYWVASYSGNALNSPSTSAYGSEIETVVPVPRCNWGWHYGAYCGCNPRRW
jgi:hypothetical protein